ncbi:hypothetical protein BKG82_26625 [Mycobacteroides chelonae]|uniref:Uncharacterized protein n=1 Tax=Mycobacteroides chelonae TaxID=1774 RepID=A0A1S1LC65_MYCCH|nr:hypothetical protein [Mycobacteroides chelonae]OHU47233.1 hypothetical protein BKG82_26625 [Mycobacteroides chelonae]
MSNPIPTPTEPNTAADLPRQQAAAPIQVAVAGGIPILAIGAGSIECSSGRRLAKLIMAGYTAHDCTIELPR